jgi:hypothetical protein
MSALAIVLIVIAVLVVALFVGGLVASARRERQFAREREEHIAAADMALQQARAADRGWDRETLEEAAHRAVAQARPGFSYEGLHLVLVDDRPGVTEDRAHFVASGRDGELRVVLTRRDAGWVAERVE